MVKQKGESSTRRYVKRLCPKENSKNWDKHLPYVELSYNNSYRASLGLKMVLFEALYGKKYQTPLFWHQVGERKVFWLRSL